jgi:hypothetical protein
MYSQPSETQIQTAKAAAARLIEFYPSIHASSPQTYAAGLVQMFAYYPEFLVAEAIDPVHGLPSECEFLPTLAKVKAFLEPRYRNHLRTLEMKERFSRKKLPEPEPNPEERERVTSGFERLKVKMGNFQ